MTEGLSVMFVSPDELPSYRKIIKALNRGMIDSRMLAAASSSHVTTIKLLTYLITSDTFTEIIQC